MSTFITPTPMADPLGLPGTAPQVDEQALAQIASALFVALPGSAPDAALAGVAPIASAPHPASTPPGLGTPPPVGGLGVAPVAPAPQSTPQITTPPVGDMGLGLAGFDPGGLLIPSTTLPVGRAGIDGLTPGQADSLYFLTGENVPTLPEIRPANPFAAPVAPALPASLPATQGLAGYDARRYRADFPILSERVGGKPLIWLDNGATTQKPQVVIDRLATFYRRENSNIHRAAHELAARATDAYEAARDKVREFLGAPSAGSIVFTRGTTEAINLVAQSWGRQNLKAGDAIILSQLEHHANIVPWVRLSQELGFEIRVAPVDDRGDIRLDEYARLLQGPVKFVGFTQVSNALGSVTPAKAMIEMAHAAGAVVLLDGAQSVSHMPVNVQALNPDFFVFSGHKIYGPTGIGALYGRPALLDAMPPWQGGGNMIEDVTFEHIRYHAAPMKLEAGTGNIADAVGLGAALDYVLAIGREAICAHEHALIAYAEMQLRQIRGLRLIGEPAQRAGVISLVMEGHSVPAIGQALSREGIAVRAGHHCAQPILRRMGVEATVRPSFGLYNTLEDVDAVVRVLRGL
jgi:cysteine desulfurase / selenocysteine lyase